MMRNGWKLALSLAIPQVVAAAAGAITVTATGSWYQQIQRPSWNPPGWVFGPVWTLLYVLMGIALYAVWKSPDGPAKRRAIILWSVQLFLNFCWSLIFFGMHRIGAAFAEIVLLWIAILLTIFAFARISRPAAWMLVPYIAWVSFAAILTFTIWKLNGY
ncbi:MAG: tryptophan-rich sensory protein [Chitinophagaceae bacterium]|nr:MAG: tryptophan-rich sensory protein [Chitinophagaceae bacterium]